MDRRLGLVVALAVLPTGIAAGSVQRPFDRLDCQPRLGVRFCEGSPASAVPSFDGTPLDVNVTLPAAGDGPFPLVVGFHGYGGRKRGLDDELPHEGSLRLARRGVAQLSYTSRGFRGSCGSAEVRLRQGPACARGWLHLDDVRWEIRDAQYLTGLLVDEGVADPQRIGAWADSYGGEPSLYLALLGDRTMLGALPGEEDGRLVPWTSPAGVPMRTAGVAAYQTWVDLPQALTPNGRHRDDTVPDIADSTSPLGVLKATFVAGLYATGQVSTAPDVIGYYAPPGADPQADLGSWVARLQAGDPYEDDPLIAEIGRQATRYRSPLSLPLDRDPAPIIYAQGWSDDLFAVDQALWLRNRLQAERPNAVIALRAGAWGHQRALERKADWTWRNEDLVDWLVRYVGGAGQAPPADIAVSLLRCDKEGPLGELVRAGTWAALHPGQVRIRAQAPVTLDPAGGDPGVGAPFDPAVAGNDGCKRVAGTDQGGGVLTIRSEPAPEGGWTLLGSPEVVGTFTPAGPQGILAARLWDVDPQGRQMLVSRGVARPRRAAGPESFQLFPAGWRIEPGHVVKLELLGCDRPFLRCDNQATPIVAADIELRLPVRERPGRAAGVVAPAPPVLPTGAELAPDRAVGASAAPARRRGLAVRVRYPRGGRRCGRVAVVRVAGRKAAALRAVAVTRGGRRLGRDGRRPFAVRLRRERVRAPLGRPVRVKVRLVPRRGAPRTVGRVVRFCRASRP